jgi:hypothetical protein
MCCGVSSLFSACVLFKSHQSIVIFQYNPSHTHKKPCSLSVAAVAESVLCLIMDWTILLGFYFRQGQSSFLLASASRLALGTTQPLIQWVLVRLFRGVHHCLDETLTTHPHIILRSRTKKSYTSIPLPGVPPWCTPLTGLLYVLRVVPACCCAQPPSPQVQTEYCQAHVKQLNPSVSVVLKTIISGINWHSSVKDQKWILLIFLDLLKYVF